MRQDAIAGGPTSYLISARGVCVEQVTHYVPSGNGVARGDEDPRAPNTSHDLAVFIVAMAKNAENKSRISLGETVEIV